MRTCVLLAIVGTVVLACLGLHDLAFTDYDAEARPAFDALLAGRLHDFFLYGPLYGGSLVLRSPLAVLADLLGGGETAVFRAVAVPGLLATGALGVVLATRSRAAGAAAPASWLVVVLCAANPLALRALQTGHSEELLASALSVAALLAAQRRHAGWAGLLCGLAAASKPWALMAAPVVLVVLPEGRRRAAALALGIPAAASAPFLIAQWSASAPTAPTSASTIFKPWQLWWPLAADPQRPPALLMELIHPAMVVLTVPVALLWARRGRAGDGLLLLAFVLLLRCLLDPWNNVYYALPLVLALTAHDALRGRTPLAAVAVTVATWTTIAEVPHRVPADAEYVLYLAWALPAAFALGLRLFAPAGAWGRAVAAATLRLTPRASAPSGSS